MQNTGHRRLAATINGSPFGENSKWWREAGAQLFKLKKLEWSAGTWGERQGATAGCEAVWGLRSSTVTWSTEEDATQGAGKPGAAGTATQGNARARTRRATSGVKTTTGRLAGFRFVSNSCAILIVKFNWHRKGAADKEVTEGKRRCRWSQRGTVSQEDTWSQQNRICEFKTGKNP